MGGSSLPSEVAGYRDQALPGGFQGLGQDSCLPDHRHEIGVAIPARHEVRVEVGDAAAAGAPEVEAHVEAIGFQGETENFLAQHEDVHEIGALLRRQILQIRDLAKRDGE